MCMQAGYGRGRCFLSLCTGNLVVTSSDLIFHTLQIKGGAIPTLFADTLILQEKIEMNLKIVL